MIKRILSTNTLPPSADASVKNFITQRKRIIGSDGRNMEIIKDRGLSLPKNLVLSYPKIPKLFKSRSDESMLLKIVQDEYFKFASQNDIAQEEAAESPIENSFNVDPSLSFLEDIDKASQAQSMLLENSVNDPHTLNWCLRVCTENSECENLASAEFLPSEKREDPDQKIFFEFSNLKKYSESTHSSNVPIIDVMNKRLCLKFYYSLHAKGKHDETDVEVVKKDLELEEPHPNNSSNSILKKVKAEENLYVAIKD